MVTTDDLFERLPSIIGSRKKDIESIFNLFHTHLRVEDEHYRAKSDLQQLKLFEIGSGSGAATRFFKAQYFNVTACDSELFATALAQYHALTIEDFENDLHVLEAHQFTPESFLVWCNQYIATEEPTEDNLFFEHYSLNQQKQGRNYFTSENARRIDRARALLQEPIFELLPAWFHWLRAEVLYRIFNCVNSSGSMKSCHQQLGGETKTRYHQITKPFELEAPVVFPGKKIDVLHGNILDIIHKVEPHDVMFVDLPSTVHQYSSNYHLLNTFCIADLWAPGEPAIDKGGIRKGYSSPFCKKRGLYQAFQQLILQATDKTKYLVIPYPLDGLLNRHELGACLYQSGKNKVHLIPGEFENLYIVTLGNWQTPEQFQEQMSKHFIRLPQYLHWAKHSSIVTKYDSQSGYHHFYYDNHFFATTDKNHHVLELVQDIYLSIPQKEKLILSVQELFNIYLGEKKWVKCLKCLRMLKQELPRKVYDEYHQMMLYVTKSLGVMKYHYKAKEIV